MNVPAEKMQLRLEIHGLVQGVGFRPFVYRMAQAHDVKGWVQNTGDGLVIEATGDADRLHQFIARLTSEKPHGARIDSLDVLEGEGAQREDFVILESRVTRVSTDFPLDVAICEECRRELSSPGNRRFQYPFITCTYCGPRFTILRALPFDRQNTSMAKFALCSECAEEYSDPENRRFHAQTISCPDCGPQLKLLMVDGGVRGWNQDALRQAASLLREGGVLALKGIGGYHIAVDATNERAIQNLRQRKRRPEKPLAVMFADLQRLHDFAQPTEAECQCLLSPASPIVLLKQHPQRRLAPGVGQGAPLLGAMLSHSPLHLLLCEACEFPLVMTSGNTSGGPVIIQDDDAFRKLGPLVDAVLTHDRDILHHADDSVVRVWDRQRTVLRLGRGLAPYVIPCAAPSGILALGGHQKNSFALTNQNKLFISQDMGTLDAYQNLQRLDAEIRSWFDLMKLQPACALHDQHPDYGSTRLATRIHRKAPGIPHHEAHVMAFYMEQQSMEAGLALAWDGWGLGAEGELWGGEFYDVKPREGKAWLRRMGSLLPFILAGADRAAREPWRCALGVAHALFGERADRKLEHYGAAACLRQKGADIVLSLLQKGQSSAQCSSVGRIFDAVASLLNIKQVCTFEAQAPMLLEGQVEEGHVFDPYPLIIQRRDARS